MLKVAVEELSLAANVIYQRRKTISLAVRSAGELFVKAPFGLPDYKVREFIFSKQKWIRKRLSAIEKSERAGCGSGITPGRILYYLGTPRTLEISGDSLIILPDRMTVPVDFTLDDLEAWDRNESHRLVNEFIEKNKAVLPQCTFKIRKQKRIWGSCNSRRNININSRISMCRPSAIEYVLWHEICHLSHMDHSKRFYNCLERLFPEYKKEKKWLSEHEFFLLI